MDKKTIIMVVVLAVVIMAYFPALRYFGIVEEPAPTPQETMSDSLTPAQSYEPTGEYAASSEQSANPALRPIINEIQAEQTEQIVVDTAIATDTIFVKTNKYTIALSSYGGGPVSLFLNEHTYRNGDPIQMLVQNKLATPEASFAGGSYSISKINYIASLAAGHYDATSGNLEIEYRHANSAGGEIIKKYVFYPDRYDFDLVIEVNQTATFGFERHYKLIWNTPLGVTEPVATTDYEAMEGVAMTLSGSRESLNDFEDEKLNQSLEGDVAWAGVRAKYFAAVIIPRNRAASAAVATGKIETTSTVDGTIDEKYINAGLRMEFASAPVIADTFTVFVGPLDYNLMADYDVGLEDMLDIGTTPFIGWIIKPFAIGIIWFLPFMYNIIPNYGWVIIIFALLVKLVTMPLSMKSFKSMNAMKELQPKLEELKKKHKKNPQALNAETMKMYKKHGVSPVSGCLPMLPQMPLFFALFSVFRSTILLRDAPFIFFIDDLSRGASSFTDPYIILVLLMIAAQFVSAKFTMASSAQNKSMMYIMPLFMGFIFYKFAAGLVLYWTCFSIFSMIDYFVFKRKNKNPQIQTT